MPGRIDGSLRTVRLVAVGDSFTEGVGDELTDGRVRGWADLVAGALRAEFGEGVRYANLAIRGKLLDAIVREQFHRALAMRPDVLLMNGGGNDMLRPGASAEVLLNTYSGIIDDARDAGVTLVLLSGANPAAGLPFGARLTALGTHLNDRVRALAEQRGVLFIDNWSDDTLRAARFWSEDRLHMNTFGHHRVAARVLEALGGSVPTHWLDVSPPETHTPRGLAKLRAEFVYTTRFVLPWIRRRLTKTSSGDGRLAKFPDFVQPPAGSDDSAAAGAASNSGDATGSSGEGSGSAPNQA